MEVWYQQLLPRSEVGEDVFDGPIVDGRGCHLVRLEIPNRGIDLVAILHQEAVGLSAWGARRSRHLSGLLLVDADTFRREFQQAPLAFNRPPGFKGRATFIAGRVVEVEDTLGEFKAALLTDRNPAVEGDPVLRLIWVVDDEGCGARIAF